ncbi:MAG: vanillate O-demethylase oxidoreductase VanB [Phycisphaerae bacterium]|nr:vanillate O-demethylase oxidoreductase VanB [Phycisphaerae bacterium]
MPSASSSPSSSSTDRIERSVDIKASVDRVWKALTDHREFSQWFRVNLEGPFVPGRTTKGRIACPGYEHLVMEVEVVAIEPMRLFSYRWHPYAIDSAVDYSKEPPTLVEFRLEPTRDGCRLQVTESGFDRIPASRRDEAFRMNSGGWTEQVQNIAKHAQA